MKTSSSIVTPWQMKVWEEADWSVVPMRIGRSASIGSNATIN